MSALAILIITVFCVNIVCILTMIFVERKKPHTIVSWFIVLNFLPIIGFLIYGIVGSGLSYKTKKMLKKKRLYAKSYEDFVKEQKQLFTSRNISKEELKYLDLMLFNLNNSNSSYLKNNSVRVFLNGEDKILALKKDLLRAKHSINILYYIFADDEVGREVMDILIQKAKEGVKAHIPNCKARQGCRTRKLFIIQKSRVGALNYSDIETFAHTTRFIESEKVPGDASVVGSTWKYVNKSGGPDKRFKDNRELPICLYGEIELKSASGLNTILMFSNADLK